jgi:hypothetical protein
MAILLDGARNPPFFAEWGESRRARASRVRKQIITSMSYMQEVDTWLDRVLYDLPKKQRQEPKRLIKAKILGKGRIRYEADPNICDACK